ncbi:protein FAM151A [Spea bombifrons]|uniref:protein FAM151A n=1 Tax=Spea bombifrons TaxID=233779 RepID=UPI00234AC885|nr:protein FAM151A [Spea bombifrons]
MKRCSVSDLRTVAGVCVFLGVCIAIAVLCLTLGRPLKDPETHSHTGGDMLEYMMSQGKISSKDGLLVTWSHGANSKSQMEAALKSDIMVLEADVNVQGYGTVNQTNIPIMAHPPDVYSDNTLYEWLDAVVDSSKGIKLDFKSIEAVSPSLDILHAKATNVKIKQPVWLNADILIGPNVNHNIAVNATRFLALVQEKFPDVTISPGWVTLYLPPLISNRTYTWEMIQQMYNVVKSVPQRVTFPARAVLTRSAWPHFNWLLQQSDRYTLTLWQGSSDPLTLEDLLFIRSSSHPEQIYYDIYDPLLSEFKEIALNPNRRSRFYSGGSLQLYFHPEDDDGLLVKWFDAEDNVTSLRGFLDNNSGMLTFYVEMQEINSNLIPVVVLSASSSVLPLEDGLKLLSATSNPWGVYLKIKDRRSLNETLSALRRQYDQRALYFPVWISMDVSYGSFSTPGYIQGKDFIGSINAIFPYVTIAPSWPAEVLVEGYTDVMVKDMIKLCEGLWQEVSFQVQAVALEESWLNVVKVMKVSPMYSLTIQHDFQHGSFMSGYKGLMAIRSHSEKNVYYKLPRDYRYLLLTSIYTS